MLRIHINGNYRASKFSKWVDLVEYMFVKVIAQPNPTCCHPISTPGGTVTIHNRLSSVMQSSTSVPNFSSSFPTFSITWTNYTKLFLAYMYKQTRFTCKASGRNLVFIHNSCEFLIERLHESSDYMNKSYFRCKKPDMYLPMHSLNSFLGFLLSRIMNESKPSWPISYFIHHQIDWK